MEETKEMQKLHGFLQCTIYLMVALEAAIFVFIDAPFWGIFNSVLIKLSHIVIYQQQFYSKLFILGIVCLVSVGTLSKKKVDLDPKNHILYPLTFGLALFFGSLWFCNRPSQFLFNYVTSYNFAYLFCSLFGTLMISLSLDNVSKLIRSGLGKDKWNTEQESFMQPVTKIYSEGSVNIPMQFYYKGKVRNGYIPISSVFRSCIILGTPGSGKTFSLIAPIIRQLMAKGNAENEEPFCLCVYDFKFPDLGKVVYYHFLLARQQNRYVNFQFHVVNLTDVERSRRINPFRRSYLSTLADASETSEALVEAMKKGDKSGGSDQFFTQSAINFLAACIYFFAKHEDGRYSSFPHVLAFLNSSYESIFSTLFTEPELVSLLSPFRSAFYAKAFDQLEGQVGTLKIFISRLATKETFWVFSGDDFDLKISDRKSPGVLVLANNPNTQNINSACYSVVVNRMTRLLNTKGNFPSALIVDECPSLRINRLEDTIATSRSMKFGIVLGLQELPMLQQQYGKESAAVVTSIIGNVLSGSVRAKDTLEWLERLCGKSRQISESLSIDRTKTSMSLAERLEPLVPAGKIASLNTGEIVGIVVGDAKKNYDGKFDTSAVNCRVNLNLAEIKHEEENYRDLPVYYDFGDRKDQILMQNFNRISAEVAQIVASFRPSVTNPNPIQKASMGVKKPLI